MIKKINNNIIIYFKTFSNMEKLLFLLIILSIIFKIINTLYPTIRGWDETVYLNLGMELSNSPLIYSLQYYNWSDYIPSNDPIYGWPNIGFRAPLLPYIYSIFYYFKLSIFIPYFIPLISLFSIYLLYILGKLLFNNKIGLVSALIFSLIPINIYTSQKIWSDQLFLFFLILTFIVFWLGYEKNIKKYKLLFGVVLSFCLLSRYTALWLVPIFFIYFVIRNKSLIFLKDKYLWFSILLFIIVLFPWLIYGYVYYDNPIGSFIHGFKASTYYGGVQSWAYFFVNSWRIFSIAQFLTIFSLFYIYIKKIYIYKEIYFLLISFVFLSLMATLMPHKEDRYILMVIPSISIIIGYCIYNYNKYNKIIIPLIVFIFLLSNIYQYNIDSRIIKSNSCFIEGNSFLMSDYIENDSIIVNNLSPIVHYYSLKKVIPYPEIKSLQSINEIIENQENGKSVYLYYSNYDMLTNSNLKIVLDTNFKKIYECFIEDSYSVVYR